MEPWVFPALMAAGLIATHYLFLRAASGRLGDALGALVLEGTAAAGIALFWLLRGRFSTLPTTRAGVVYAALSGVAISGASILLFAALRKGGPVSSTGTLVLGGGVALSALAAPVLFAEGMSARRLLGVGLGLVGMVILATEASPNPAP
jgi:uncharacterized membrane protein